MWELPQRAWLPWWLTDFTIVYRRLTMENPIEMHDILMLRCWLMIVYRGLSMNHMGIEVDIADKLRLVDDVMLGEYTTLYILGL